MMRLKMPFYSAAFFTSLALFSPLATVGQAVKVTHKLAAPQAKASSLSVSATPSGVSIALVSKGSAIANSPISITTAWSDFSKNSTIHLYGYFTSSSAALTGNLSGDLIPSSCVYGQMTTGLPTTYSAFTQTNPLGGAAASLDLFSQAVTGRGSASRTDALNLEINLTSLPTLPADTYTGTLIIEAQEL
jgi:hypothetical protein